MGKNLFIDIETIPAGAPVDPSTLKPPSQMKKAETIAEWHKNEAPALAEEAWKKRALDSMAGQVLCIGWICGDEGGVICREDERSTLFGLALVLQSIMGQYKELPTFVGWNINTFDIPWIWRKAIQYDIKTLRDAINRDRYKGNSIDLMAVWAADFKDYRKMSDVATFLGLEDRSNGIDGSKVYDLYKEGRIEEIKTYCMGDVETVRDIYRRIYE